MHIDMDKSKCGRLGANAFWKRFASDEIFKEKMKTLWKTQKVDLEQKKKAGKLGAEARWKGHTKKQKTKERKQHPVPPKNQENSLLRSRLCGYLSGDGGVYIRKEKHRKATHYDISFYPDHESLIPPFVDAFENLYGKKPKVKCLGNYYSVHVCSKLACEDLVSITSFGTLSWVAPHKILDSVDAKREWLKTYFDSEAHVSKNSICVQSVNEQGLNQIKSLLETFGITSRIYKYERKEKNWNTNHLLFISTKRDRERYLNEIGFNHVLKSNKLKAQLSSRGARIR
ncbi:MAG TPA: hypothetical protein ENN30_01640 [Candidatus Woesearchaeota archaeon]|nr:hypothetical protein [Candidatus Woesearchaeota archaeon]